MQTMAKSKGSKQRRPTAVEFFCGAGGMSLGMEQAGFDVLLGVDVDGHHASVHKRNFPNHPALCRSVEELTADGIYESIGQRLELDLVCGGPPCQGFSNMGLRDLKDPRNSLVDHFARLIAELRPKCFVMENVPGMANGKTKPVLDAVVKFLEESGYTITKPVQILDASDFGVPQKRKRLFLLGARSDLGITLRYPNGPCRGQAPRPTVWEAISDLPTVEGQDSLFRSDETNFDKEPESEYAKVARGLLADPSDFSHPREWNQNRCTGSLRIRHVDKAVELYRSTTPGDTVPGHRLPRLHPDGLCPTLRAGSDSTHGSHTAPRPVHPVHPRCITAREAARLHGFPDWFSFYPTKWHAYRQIGNAVCPPVARAVGQRILDALGIEPIKPSKAHRLTSEFQLPEVRPKTKKRIPIMRNFPPVITRLFENAYDEKSGTLKRSGFRFSDVEEAIRATGVLLPWARSDNFVPELARTRRVRELLAACLAKGYSIRPSSEGDYIGEFVAEGEPGDITDKHLIEIKSRDINGALDLGVQLFADKLVRLLDEPAVIRNLWEERLRVEPAGPDGKFKLLNGKAPVSTFSVMLAGQGNLPSKGRVRRFGIVSGTPDVVLLASVTNRHVAAIRFSECDFAPVEARRCVFQVELSKRAEPTLFGTLAVAPTRGRGRRIS